jgi:hypothetical protein
MTLITSLLCAAALLGVVTPLAEASTSTAKTLNVTTSNVAEDLICFYKDTYPENTLSYLVPHKVNGDSNEDFKFITMYAYQGNLYLYFFTSYATADFTNVFFEYSDSTTMNTDQTAVNETWHLNSNAFNCTVHDINGTAKRFYKAVAKNFYTYSVGTEHRIKASRLLCYADSTFCIARSCDDAEYSWKDQAANEEQVYTYYKDNYIVINQAAAITQLLPIEYTTYYQTESKKAKEFQWLFFDYSNTSKGANYDIGNLTSIDISYDYLTFDAKYRIDSAGWGMVYYRSIYGGLYNNAEQFLHDAGHGAREPEFSLINSSRMTSTVTPSSQTLDITTDTSKFFFFWERSHHLKYSYNRMQKLDDVSFEKISDTKFKEFIGNHRSGYKYAIDFKEDYRQVTNWEDSWSNAADWFNQTTKVTTRCHQANATQIVRLTFENEDGKADFNAIMNPVDVSEVVTTKANQYETIEKSKSPAATLAKKALWALIGGGIAIGAIFLLVFYFKNRVAIKAAFSGFKKKPSYQAPSNNSSNNASYSSRPKHSWRNKKGR